MTIALGIHLGHDSSCSLVMDGVLVSAIQSERLSRKKHDAILSLSNSLPVQAVLETAGVGIDDVDVIVSSFQWVGPGGFGLHRSVVEPHFSLFDPWADRHRVISHHLAHAHSTFETSSFTDAAVLICDYAGSPSVEGTDYAQTFRSWYTKLSEQRISKSLNVECSSIYRVEAQGHYHLLDRTFNIAHPGQASFVYSVAGLYENVSRYVLGHPSAHGELMALAAHGKQFSGERFDPGRLVEEPNREEVFFRNDWQHALPSDPDFRLKCCLAWRCQEAAEIAILAAGRKAVKLSNSKNLAVAGGVFLNILANTRLATSGVCSRYHVPSAPHDAGISVGCAFYGSRALGRRSVPPRSDRLGYRWLPDAGRRALVEKRGFVDARPFRIADMIRELCDGKIIARWNGRAEFGPRALGGRSLLASPLSETTKDRLNRIKDRELWRPVAPVVPKDELLTFFDGPIDCHWMTMSHTIRAEHRTKLVALSHPDGSTRAQALMREDDEELFSWLKMLGAACGYPILVNTSFNRRGEPIVESPAEAIDMFLDKPDIDLLILNDVVVQRSDPLIGMLGTTVTLNPDAIISRHFVRSQGVIAVSASNRIWRISEDMHNLLIDLGTNAMLLELVASKMRADPSDTEQIRAFLIHGILRRHE